MEGKAKKNNMFLDFTRKYQIYFQDHASPIMEGIINLHHDIFFICLLLSL
jgi:hypothetical protein